MVHLLMFNRVATVQESAHASASHASTLLEAELSLATAVPQALAVDVAASQADFQFVSLKFPAWAKGLSSQVNRGQ